MINHDSLYVILFSIPIYQILFYTVQLVSFRRRNPSKKYLGMLLLSMTGYLVLTALQSLGYVETFSWMYFLYTPILLTIAPSFFLYILSITRENHDVRGKQRTILFIPAVIVLLLNLILLGVTSAEERTDFLSTGIISGGEELSHFPLMIITPVIGIILVFFQIAFAVIKLLKIINTESEIMRLQPSHLAYLEWPWIIGISISVLIFMVVNAMFSMIWPMNNLGIALIFNILMLLTGGLAGYLGMKQDTLLNQVARIGVSSSVTPVPETENKEKQEQIVQKSQDVLPQDEIHSLLSLIPRHLEKDKPYLRSDYSLHDLCTAMNVSRRKLSYVLNEVMGKNFYGLINEYRVKEAQELLRQDATGQFKIEALGEMVGFQSKSSFNACFKKYTGLTPTEYKMRGKAME